MKKKLILIILFLVIISLVTTLFFFKLNKNNREIIKKNNDIAIMVDGVEEIAFPSKQNYVFEKAVCNGEEVTASDTGTDNFNITIQSLDKTSNCVFYFIEAFEYTETFTYTASAPSMTWTVPKTGTYKIELWGAQGKQLCTAYGRGGYTSGEITLTQNEKLYIFLGESTSSRSVGAFNGGGVAYPSNYSSSYAATGAFSGGGATDIRLINTSAINVWNEANSLQSRIMVAAGGGGKGSSGPSYSCGETISGADGEAAGGLIGYEKRGDFRYYRETNTPVDRTISGGTQTSGGICTLTSYCGPGSFGAGGNSSSTNHSCGSGGGGYYGGAADRSSYTSGTGGLRGGAGGSSYISGHKGCVAIVGSTANPSAPLTPRKGTSNATCTTGINDELCSEHYSGKVFSNTKMIDGIGLSWTNVVGSAEVMPNPNGGNYDLNTGHAGNGYARITYIN